MERQRLWAIEDVELIRTLRLRRSDDGDPDHHPDLPPADGLEWQALAGCPDVDGLGLQHLDQRRAALDRV